MARLIKRYENRKLYDTVESRYVSLRDLAELVRSGEDVQIIDKVSGKDITAQTLTQVILEEGKRGKSVISTELLHELLRKSGEMLDSGLAQLRHGVDDFVQQSIHRLHQLVSGNQAQELQQLREQVARLEDMVKQLLEQNQQAVKDRSLDSSAQNQTNRKK